MHSRNTFCLPFEELARLSAITMLLVVRLLVDLRLHSDWVVILWLQVDYGRASVTAGALHKMQDETITRLNLIHNYSLFV